MWFKIMKNARSVSVVILLTLVGVILLVALWFGSWALKRANTTQQYKVNTNNQQYQAGLVSQERDRVVGYDDATDPGQKAQIKSTFCVVYLTLKPAPEDLVQANSRIC